MNLKSSLSAQILKLMQIPPDISSREGFLLFSDINEVNVRPDTHLLFTAYEDYQLRDIALAEKKLMSAILRSAMEDMTKRGDAYRDARRYFMSEDEFYLYSFLNVCYHLDLCPKTVRRKLGLAECN